MQRVNNLVIRGEEAEVAKLVGRIERNQVVADWVRDLEAESRLNSADDFAAIGVYCFVNFDGPLRPVSLILRSGGRDQMHVSSMITKDGKPLTDVDYNRILGDFHANVLIQMSVGIKLVVEMRPPRVEMAEFLSPQAMDRLRDFGIASVKEDDLLPDYPSWDRFVIQAHLDNDYVELEDLDYWLMSEGFTQEDRQKLRMRFLEGSILLGQYDLERVGR